jgi:hypothetical protein
MSPSPGSLVAATRPEFACELPRFVAEVRRIFSKDDIAAYFEAIEEDAGSQHRARCRGTRGERAVDERGGQASAHHAVAGVEGHAVS